MLLELVVKDFAIIDSLQLQLMNGLNILSGETGAGKSIIVGALGLLMGGRASSELIRTGTNEAVVEASFDITDNPNIKDLLLSWGVETDDDLLIIRRTIARDGKNRIFIGDRLATIRMLSQVGGRLIDISGQYSQQLLLQVERHIDILDAFGDVLGRREQYRKLYNAFYVIAGEMKALVDQEDQRLKRRELVTFQNDEIIKARLIPGEEEDLRKEKIILSNARRLYEKTYGVYTRLYEDDGACLNILKSNLREIEEAAGIDSSLASLKENFESALINLEDSAFSLRSYAEKINFDSERLEALEVRLDEIQSLKRKYGNSIDEILSYQQEIERELEGIEGNSRRIEELRAELNQLADKLWELAEQLSKKRAKAVKILKKEVESELNTIGMQKAEFFTKVAKTDKSSFMGPESVMDGLNANGMDRVEFFISPNQGEDPKPLSRIASGGEISRIVLALKKILAANYRVPTLLFDEVDAGIGGAVAEAVGGKLKEIAISHQVLCITHLPQIACFGSSHYCVVKKTSDGRTVTNVELLDNEGRLEEISRMLGGKKISEKTRAHAAEMLRNAN